jgi:hypothetical protein
MCSKHLMVWVNIIDFFSKCKCWNAYKAFQHIYWSYWLPWSYWKSYFRSSIYQGRYFFVLYVMFVMLKPPKLWCPLLHSQYCWKALNE